ncbi:hypothetical protein EYB53_015305 [Candidatus Chloroploca sp. M-50]|uniref:DUF304 domain-containing protein n=1 Tax=Candidatus Chloroploca mongolica TaxID=2528176 RepID=A0ABS4DCB1_9CHLR|nr:hypothetical protein [Candidatus Chloroploca mongolica]MBP1467081.1 hypothetical protein [Candidatus Chloroploca mongolica]
MSAEERTVSGLQQRIGRRLSVEPYYMLVEQSPERVELASRSDANRSVGMRVVAGGAAMIVVALIIAVSGLWSAGAGSGFAVAALASVIGGLLGGLGFQRMLGGYAILTTYNTLVADAEAQTLVLRQASRVGAARTQLLRFHQITSLRLNRRPLAVGWPIRRLQPIVALELLVGDHVWVIETAADAGDLVALAQALATVLEKEFVRE